MKGTSKYWCVFEPLGEGERKDYAADFTAELVDDTGTQVDTIASASWTYEPEGKQLTLDGDGVTGNLAAIFVSEPEAGTFYRLVVTVTTAGNRTYEKALGIPSQVIDGTK